MITLTVGQAVYWPPAPGGMAQIDDLLRTHVRLLYYAGTGRLRRPRVAVRHLASLQSSSWLPLHNPVGRAVRPRSKTYLA